MSGSARGAPDPSGTPSGHHPGMVATTYIDAGTRSGAVPNVSRVGAGFIGRMDRW